MVCTRLLRCLSGQIGRSWRSSWSTFSNTLPRHWRLQRSTPPSLLSWRIQVTSSRPWNDSGALLQQGAPLLRPLGLVVRRHSAAAVRALPAAQGLLGLPCPALSGLGNGKPLCMWWSGESGMFWSCGFCALVRGIPGAAVREGILRVWARGVAYELTLDGLRRPLSKLPGIGVPSPRTRLSCERHLLGSP